MQGNRSKPASTPSVHSMEGERPSPLVFQNLKIVLNDCKVGRAKSHACMQALDKGCLK
jgi:hypothetical protein